MQTLTEMSLDIIDRRHHTLDRCSTKYHSAFSDWRAFFRALFARLEKGKRSP